MAQLVFSPLQFNTISEELDINGDYRCFEVPNKVYVDSDILISEFCSTIFNFSTVRIGQYLEDIDILPAVNDEDSSNETPMPWSVTGFFLTRPLLLSLIY